jgi:glycosyltransferase involved in cell wall biosynthesis
MDLPPLTYLTVDSMAEGVGASQVVPYVTGLASRGVDVTLHSFEKHDPDEALRRRLADGGVRWRAHRWRGGGSVPGLARVAQGAAFVARAELVHARSDMPAASAMLARRRAWVWDVRGFWRDDRMALGLLKPGSVPERLLRTIETGAARSSSAIITLSQNAADELAGRHGGTVAAKVRVITTCVDLDRFALSPLPPADPARFLLAGSLSELYDISTMLRLVERVRARRPVELTVLTPGPTAWEPRFREHGATVGYATPREMPDRVRQHHVGLSIRRFDIGVTSYSATPTKLGEFLACGRPVVVNAGLGDLDSLLARFDCGVVAQDSSDGELDRVAAELDRLLDDPGTAGRCRSLAEHHFDLERGVDQLLATYVASVAAVA